MDYGIFNVRTDVNACVCTRGVQGIFLPESTFSADSLTVSVKPSCAIACIHIYAHVKDPVVHVRVRWIMETLKTSSMHRRLGSATLSQLASPGESNPDFPWEKSEWDNTVRNKNMILMNPEGRHWKG